MAGRAFIDPDFDWRTSSYSANAGGNCVEVNLTTPGHVGVRDSKRLTGDVHLRFDPSTWARFLAETRLGTFDRQ